MTYGELHDALSPIGADVLIKTLYAIEEGSAPREKQVDSGSCYAPMISRETGHIDFSKNSKEILNLIRGMNPYPMSYCKYGETDLKIIKAHPGGNLGCAEGTAVVNNKSISVACGDGKSIVIDELQFKGGKRMTVESYLNGHDFESGIILR